VNTVLHIDLHSRTLARPAYVSLTLLLLSSLAPLRPSIAQSVPSFRLAGVKVIGSTRHEESEIILATGLKLAGGTSPEGLKEAANKLASTGAFAQVNYRYETRGDALTVEFTVKDTPELLPCSFENFVWFSKEELIRGLHSRVPLFDGQAPPSGGMLESVSSALMAMLEDRGIHAQVQFAPRAKIGGPVQGIQFRVVGVTVPVRKVEFTGVQQIDPAWLQEAARPLLNKDFDASFIKDFCRESIASVYLQRGYLRAEFGDPVPQLLRRDEPPNSALITIPVSEGSQYQLKGIGWSGSSVIPYGDLEKSIRAVVGSPVNAVQLQQDVFALPMLFHPKGYITAVVKSKELLDDAAHTVAYQLQVDQGDLYRLGKLEMTGLDDFHLRSLEKLCRMQPGDPYDRTYWTRFSRENARNLPPNPSGWNVKPQETIHSDTKSVDVRLIFTPRGN
jgi:outer membrane protein assembly factor BamA